MADACAKASFRPRFCDVTAGPGATNPISGAAEAWTSPIPLTVLTSDIDTLFVGGNSNLRGYDERAGSAYDP